jgi:hypothetical protein
MHALAFLYAYAAAAADEAPVSSAVLGTFQACSQCAILLGVDPQYAPIAALVTAVVLRPVLDDVWSRVKAAWTARRESAAPKPPEPPAPR